MAGPRRELDRTDRDDLRYNLRISVWVRWFLLTAWLLQFNYRPNFADPAYIPTTLFALSLLALNGYVHYRIRSHRTVTWRWALALSVMDGAMITAGIAISSSGFHNTFFVLYYPALAMFAVVFARIAVMYTVVAAVNLVSRFERIRRREAVEREGELQRERIELSQTIHDTIAQSAYMMGLGIETAIELAKSQNDDGSDELIAKLEAVHALSKSTMWELRHPIDAGPIFEGREFGRVLRSHASTFTTITSVPTGVEQSGREPWLSTVTRGLLFSIAHNAMTNAFRHARADRVAIALSFEADRLRMSVADNGIGLPEDYAERGHGFRNMRRDVERMGGSLEVGPGESGRGTMVTCVVPYDANRGGE